MNCARLTLGLLILSIFATEAGAADRVTRVRVDKSERRLELLAADKVIATYPISLGGDPLGHKQREGDERTPEGRYLLDWRNPGSAYYRSIHISYPAPADIAAAKRGGYSPGGDIMIHGQPNGYGWWSWLTQRFDWTNGCIAVTDEAMAEIWSRVPDGTPIEIQQ